VFETPGVVRASIEADGSVAKSLSKLLPGEKFEDFGGLFGSAVRKADLRPAMSRRSPATLEALWPDRGPVLAWTVRSSTEPGAGDGLGWLVLGVGADRVTGVADGLSVAGGDSKGGQERAALAWVSVFEVRPREVIGQLSGQALDVPPLLRALGAVERVRAQTMLARPDLLRGGGVIEFVEPEAGKE
jgi:hypothetical protein